MNKETKVTAAVIAAELDDLLKSAESDTAGVVASNDIPSTAIHFSELRDTVDDLSKRMSALKKHVDALSYDILPTLFTNANVKTINVIGLGNVTINVRWSATMLDKEKGMEWLRETGNQGLIIPTVNAQTLTAFAKTEALAGKSLPSDLFRVGTSQLVSIRKSGVSNDE